MQLSPSAQDLRNLADKIARINEVDTHTDTGEPDHEITSSELMRLKVALRPLVDGEKQSRFTQVLNKLNSGQPITTAEARLITAAFASMADIIATDSSLLSRLRKDITDFNKDHEPKATKEEPEEESEDNIAKDIDLDLDSEYERK
jgi:hypothetical protein